VTMSNGSANKMRRSAPWLSVRGPSWTPSGLQATCSGVGFYVTERLAERGYKHRFPDAVKKSYIAHDTHESGPCFWMSSVVMRRILGVLAREYMPVAADGSNTTLFFEDLYGSRPTCGHPVSAMDAVFGGHVELPLSEKTIRDIVTRCEKWPAILPYCPTPPSGLMVIQSVEERIEAMIAASAMMLTKKKPLLHSMCVAGVCYKEGIPYMACAQTWKGSDVVLIPFVSNAAFYGKGIDDEVYAEVIRLNRICFHAGARIPTFPLPLRASFSYHRAPCLPPPRNWIAASLSATDS
jgi:hypothetical protein